MAEADLQQFLEKVRQLNAFVALSEHQPQLRSALSACRTHGEVVALARSCGFEIGRRWGEDLLANTIPSTTADSNLRAGSEDTTVLVETPDLRLERIHSCQAASPEGFWYDQEEHEWVMLLEGSACLQFADEDSPRQLNRGDSLLIRAHRRHRLLATDPLPGSVWLALFWREG